MSFQWVDWCIFLGIGLGVYYGYKTGAIYQVLRLVGLAVAFILSVYLIQPVSWLLTAELGIPEGIAPVLAFGGLILIGIALVMVTAGILEYLFGALEMNVLNRLMGGAVGGLKATLILGILLWLFNSFNLPSEQTRRSSVMVGPVQTFTTEVWETSVELWPWIQDVSRELSQQVRRKTQDHLQEEMFSPSGQGAHR